MSPAISRCKLKTIEVEKVGRAIQQLNNDLNGTLKEHNFFLKESEETRIINLVQNLCYNIDVRFSQSTCRIAESFGILDIQK